MPRGRTKKPDKLADIDLSDVLTVLPSLSLTEQEQLLAELDKLEELKTRKNAQEHFMPFVKEVWPTFISGRHHEKMAKAFEEVANGTCKRLIIAIGPRHTKSEFASYLLPAWFLGKYPHKKVIQASNTAELAVGFGRKVRNLIDSEPYKRIFPGVELRSDSKAAGRWNTNANGDYFAIGVDGTVTGKGADLFIIDDPHAITLDTPIATTTGWKTIGTITVGDFVFGPDGLPTEVVGKSEVWCDRPIYEVETDDGAVIEVDGGHLWSIRTDTKKSAPHKNLTTRELLAWSKSSRPCLPRSSAVHYPEATLPIHPWVLGAWLGDGTSTSAKITAHPDDAPYMRSQFERFGFETTDQSDPYNFGVIGLWSLLKAQNLLGNKHIPEAYLAAAPEQRLLLLQGLMDTDGEVSKSGQCVFHNKDRALVEQVREILHSLGHKCKIHSYMTGQSKSSHAPCLMHRVCFKMQDAALMPRKRERSFTSEDKRCRSITVRETSRRGSVQCITVARSDGLFLVGKEYVVTHNSEQEAKIAETNPEIFDKVYEWYTSGPRQRLQPGGAIVIIATRWSQRDLTARVLKAAAERGGEEWKVIEFPAILPSGNPLWPEFWSLEELENLRNELPNSKWQAQYQQSPTSDSAAIIKREWWKEWPNDTPPDCEFVLQCWDTAFEKTNRADYSACTTWGVFYRDSEQTGMPQANIILLDMFKDRLEFPELKKAAIEAYKEWQPDSVVIEKKASGAPLLYEMRSMGIPVQEFTPTRGNDKIARLNACADVFASGKVWYPSTRWAEEVVDEVASFPASEHDDITDTVSMAIMRFRKGGFVTTDLDEPDEPQYYKKKVAYY